MTEDQAQNNESIQAEPVKPPEDELVVTKHTITIDGQEIPYTVTCGTLVIKEEAVKEGEEQGESEGEKSKASIFFIAYIRRVADD